MIPAHHCKTCGVGGLVWALEDSDRTPEAVFVGERVDTLAGLREKEEGHGATPWPAHFTITHDLMRPVNPFPPQLLSYRKTGS